MFSHLSRRFILGTATVALVLTAAGGAYGASKYLITSIKQIKPSVRSALTGPAGKNGAPGATGATGAQGPAGPQGPAGANGTSGEKGEKGETGKEGPPGKNGAMGKEGSPWTELGTLPAEKTETGTWSYLTGADESTVQAAISFPIPLKAPLSDAGCSTKTEPCQIHFVTREEAKNKVVPPCPGNTEKPEAEPGNLCIYEQVESSLVSGSIPLIVPPSESSPPVSEIAGAGIAGAVMYFGESEEEGGYGYGDWAVTGEPKS